MKTGKARFRLNIDVRKELIKEGPCLNSIKTKVAFVKGQQDFDNFRRKSTTAANVHLMGFLLGLVYGLNLFQTIEFKLSSSIGRGLVDG